MQKILIVSTKDLSSQPMDGSQKRISDIAKFLSKKNKIESVFIGKYNFKNNLKTKYFYKSKIFEISFFQRIINVLFSIIKLEPMQNGYFFSKKMQTYIDENKNNYDIIIFHLIRSAQYLPNNFKGKAILEMTDLISSNYDQIIKNTSYLNPIKYLYFFENLLLKRYELEVSNIFDKVVFISNNEIMSSKLFIEKNKIEVIGNTFEIRKQIFRYSKNNYKILFVGNINYLPNKIACYNFAKKILPRLYKKYSHLEFNIVGKINILDKFFLSKIKNVKIHGPVKKLDTHIKQSICGVCNLNIATGIQTKIFTYMSYGLPAIVHNNSFPKSILRKNHQVFVYKNDDQLVSYIFKLIENKKIANKISKSSFRSLKMKFNSSKIYGNYLKTF